MSSTSPCCPKSVTTAISMDVSRELGRHCHLPERHCDFDRHCGRAGGRTVCKVFRITNPIAKGIGIGTASHAVGTSKALKSAGGRRDGLSRCYSRYHDRRALPAVLGIDSLNTEGPPAHHLVCGARTGLFYAAGQRKRHFCKFLPGSRGSSCPFQQVSIL